jgi:DNA-binding response OmpR family regulator
VTVQYSTLFLSTEGVLSTSPDMIQAATPLPTPVIALFNASDDTVEMVRRMLDASGFNCLVGCHFSDLKKGVIDFARFLGEHDPEVVILDISPPYAENWEFFKKLRDSKAMAGRGLVVTTTNKDRLDETVRKDSEAIEIVGKPYDLDQINVAIQAALKGVSEVRGRSQSPESRSDLSSRCR